jgi:cell volume regulation protein A
MASVVSIRPATDAASVLQVLGNERIGGRVRETIELESGLNDPMAFVLVAAFAQMATGGGFDAWSIQDIAWKMGAGAVIGLAIGWVSGLALAAFEEDSPEVYPIITIALALLSYGAAEMLHASGLLAVFMTALTLGNSADLPFRSTIVRFHASLAYLAEIIMFLVLGLLVQPQALMEPRLVGAGIFLALALAFVSRPVAVMTSRSLPPTSGLISTWKAGETSPLRRISSRMSRRSACAVGTSSGVWLWSPQAESARTLSRARLVGTRISRPPD